MHDYFDLTRTTVTQEERFCYDVAICSFNQANAQGLLTDSLNTDDVYTFFLPPYSSSPPLTSHDALIGWAILFYQRGRSEGKKAATGGEGR